VATEDPGYKVGNCSDSCLYHPHIPASKNHHGAFSLTRVYVTRPAFSRAYGIACESSRLSLVTDTQAWMPIFTWSMINISEQSCVHCEPHILMFQVAAAQRNRSRLEPWITEQLATARSDTVNKRQSISLHWSLRVPQPSMNSEKPHCAGLSIT